jgi:hypothetical protein
VLIGKAAARFIRAEAHRNAESISMYRQMGNLSRLYDDAWRAHGIELAPLLTPEASELALITYLGLPIAAEGGTDESFRLHCEDFTTVASWMYCIETKGRFKVLVEPLRGRPTLPSGDTIKQRLARLPLKGQ